MPEGQRDVVQSLGVSKLSTHRGTGPRGKGHLGPLVHVDPPLDCVKAAAHGAMSFKFSTLCREPGFPFGDIPS